MPTVKARIKRHIHYKLARRIKLYFFISIVMVGVVVYEVIATGLSPFIALWLGILGIFIGSLFARMFKVYRDRKEMMITSRMDQIGGILLWVYLMFSVARHFIISHYVQASFVFAITFAIVAGVMIGRFLGMRKSILKILKKQEII